MRHARKRWQPAALTSAVVMAAAIAASFTLLAVSGESSAPAEDRQDEAEGRLECIDLAVPPAVVEPYWEPIPRPYEDLDDAVIVPRAGTPYTVDVVYRPAPQAAVVPKEERALDVLPRDRALALALRWLAEHQMSDGGWSFDLGEVPDCRGKCGNSGKLADARVAATSLTLLAFLGCGQTHKEGKHNRTVEKGLAFLLKQMKLTPDGGSLMDDGGKMYSHGLATLALCEAYGMTKDKALYTPAQKAIEFVCHAQDPKGGGWGLEPQKPGDTSIVVWQLLALKSGHMAYLRVPPANVKQAFDFLDSVQADEGATYGTTKPGNDQTATAAGLLCRMYLGWKPDNPALVRGVAALSKQGPSAANIEYNYFATHVLRHGQLAPWEKWTDALHARLPESQAGPGHEAGSWFFDGKDRGLRAEQGGRLYCTAMAAMILEVRFVTWRYAPSEDEDFPE